MNKKEYQFKDDLIIYPFQWKPWKMNDIRLEIRARIPLKGNPNKMDIYSIIFDMMNESRDPRGMIFFRLIESNRLHLIGLNPKDYQRLEYRIHSIR